MSLEKQRFGALFAFVAQYVRRASANNQAKK
jgi:hypothetical protein